MLQWLIITILIHQSLSFGLYDDIDDFELWPRGGPSVPTDKLKCKKDILVLWDNSKSIGDNTFKNVVKPFLKLLINSPQLNVGPDGTNIAFITFSTQPETRVLLRFNEIKQDPASLTNWLDNLDYHGDNLYGDGTRTGLAFKIAAEEMFTRSNPMNHRTDVDDVVLLFTDGDPVWRTHRDHKPKPEDKFGFRTETEMANFYSSQLKAKGVSIVGLAVGTPAQLNSYFPKIESWSSSNLAFKEAMGSLENVIDKLVDASCIGPGQCKCDEVTAEVFKAPGESDVLVRWENPEFSCERDPVDEVITVSPKVTSPARFSKDTTITYTHSYNVGDGRTSVQCFVHIKVGACECSKNVQTVRAKLTSGSSKAYVRWEEPTVTCEVKASASNPNSPNGYYSIGKHTVEYKFTRVLGGGNSFDVSCLVNIEVTGQLCDGKSYNPALEECCCGQKSDKKAGYKCCGKNYYNPRTQTCCSKKRGNLVSYGENCP